MGPAVSESENAQNIILMKIGVLSHFLLNNSWIKILPADGLNIEVWQNSLQQSLTLWHFTSSIWGPGKHFYDNTPQNLSKQEEQINWVFSSQMTLTSDNSRIQLHKCVQNAGDVYLWSMSHEMA